jgi:SAM-dependent methyltransferase
MMTDDPRRERAIRDSYDHVPYASMPWRYSHPVWLGSLAFLYGLDPVPPDACRFLEIGCATGGNLIPLAAAYPESEFVGVDLSPVQIEAGRATADASGLGNVRLLDMSLVDIDESYGDFDYIVAHGVFSWVPDGVRNALLGICGRRLSRRGLAFVSYNTYPGWHLRQMVREMLVEHTLTVPDLDARMREATRFLEFLAGELEGRKPAYSLCLGEVRDQLRSAEPYYLAHEYLSPDNRPVHFRQFVEGAAHFGLRYVAEANHPLMHLDNLPPERARELLSFGDDRIAVEQNLDYLRGRLFRQSVLCRAEHEVPPLPDLSRIPAMHLAANVEPEVEGPDFDSDVFEVFVDIDGATTRVAHPLAKAALVVLGEQWPRAVPFPELVAAARERLDPAADAEAVEPAICAAVLGVVWRTGIAELQAWPYPFVSVPGERPAASAHARHEARLRRSVTNLRHERIELAGDAARRVLPLLNGTRTAAEVRKELGIAEGEVTLALRNLAESALLGA